MGQFTVRLEDTKYGRVVLDEVNATSGSAAISAAEAAPPVSGDNQGAFNGAGQVVDQSQVLSVSGTDTNGNPIAGPAQLPPVPPVTARTW